MAEGEKKETFHDPKNTTSSVKHGRGRLMTLACEAASATASPDYRRCECRWKERDDF